MVNSIRQFCSESGISKSLLYVLWKRGEGPRFAKLGRRRVITESPLDFLLRAQESGHTRRDRTFEFQPSALSAWQDLPPDAGHVILTVSKRARNVPVILAVTLPQAKSKPVAAVQSIGDGRSST